jgi:hypothetical protein
LNRRAGEGGKPALAEAFGLMRRKPAEHPTVKIVDAKGGWLSGRGVLSLPCG